MHGSIGVPELIILFVMFGFIGVFMLLAIWPAAKICKRVGMSPWLAVLMVVPIGNIVLMWVLAMSRWPSVQADPNGPVVQAPVL